MATVHPFPNPVSPRTDQASAVATARTAFSKSRRAQMLVGALAIFLLFAVDAALRFPGRLDIATINLVQRLDLPYLAPVLNVFDQWTNSDGAVRAWVTTLAIFVLLRWWLPALSLFALPLGGIINESISLFLIQRSRPHLAELRHASLNFEERSFPSGHVVGAVLLYGFIWYIVGQRVERTAMRRVVRAVCLVIVPMAALDRIWGGAHWPSDVGAALALGLTLLFALVMVSEWIERDAAALRAETGWFAAVLESVSRSSLPQSKQGVRIVRQFLLALAPQDRVSRGVPSGEVQNRR